MPQIIREIDVLVWESRNLQRVVFYNSDTGTTGAVRTITTEEFAIDPEQPTSPGGSPASAVRTHAPGTVIEVFCEGTDEVTLTSVSADPHASVASEADAEACALPDPETCDLAAVVLAKTDTEVSFTVTTSHPPFYGSRDGVTYFEGVSAFDGLDASTLSRFYFKDAQNCQIYADAVTEDPEPEPVPPGVEIDSFVEDGEVIQLFYQATPVRRIVFYSPSGRTELGDSGIITAEVRQRAASSVFDPPALLCEGTTQVRFLARLFAPYATIFDVANAAVCGYTPPDPDPDPDPDPNPDPDPEPEPGACDDPESDSYGSTENGGLCTYTPKLELDLLDDLVALGRPVPVTLHSAEIVWATPAAATATIQLQSPDPGDTLTVNGYEFTFGPATLPQRFADAETLADALNAMPGLRADYLIQQIDADRVGLTARRVGRRYQPVITLESMGMAYERTLGQDMYYSERRTDWGLWLEVWAVPGAVFGPGQSKAGAVLAGSFEMRYREDNAYQFDIAEPLRQFTGLSYDASDRLTGYFLRFGETYAEVAGGYRRRKRVGESNVLFGLEAVEIMPPAIVVPGGPGNGSEGFPYEFPIAFDGTGAGPGTGMAAGFRRLSRRPGAALLTGQLTTILNPTYAGPVQVDVEHRTATGVTSTEADVASIDAGGLTTLRAVWLGAPEDAERSRVLFGGALAFTARPAVEASRVLSFANGQGGMESVTFAPVVEPQGKRSTQLVATVTGRRTYAAELPDVRRLTTGPLTQDVYEWLLAELGNSAAVWLEAEGAPLPVNVTDFDAQADYAAGEFSLTVEIEPQQQPARGLTN